MSRKQQAKHRKPLTLGDYFSAARRFIESLDAETLSQMTSGFDEPLDSIPAIESVQIRLEKHGAFYHPSRVLFQSGGNSYPFVLNVAVSKSGLGCYQHEFRQLHKLNNKYGLSFIPEIYAEGKVVTPGVGHFGMFIGEWFDGFHEVHLTRGPEGKEVIGVWDPERGPSLLSEPEMAAIYHQASLILTYYYDVLSFERIHHWHHASGDFIVKTADNDFSAKLVTVRNYSPMIEAEEIDAETVISAMLFFLFDLSVKMRFDRLDGVGSMTWADDVAVAGTITGFLEGLRLKQSTGQYPDASLEIGFKNCARSCRKQELRLLADHVMDSYPDTSPENALIARHLHHHLDVFYDTLRKFIINER